MRVLMMTRYPLPGEGPFGGVEAAACALVAGLREMADVDLRLLVLRADIDRRLETTQDGVTVTYAPHAPRAAAFTLYRLARRILAEELHRRPPDLVHAQGLEAEGYAVSRVSGIPRVITPHGNLWMDDTLNGTSLRRRARGLARQRLARLAVRSADGVVSVGDGSTNLAAHGRLVARIPNAVRPEFFAPALPLPQAPARVLVPCNIKRIKGIEHVLAAAGTAAETRGTALEVRVAGRVEDGRYHRELERLAASMPHLSFTCADARDAAEMVREYDEADVVALGSRWEIAPIVIGEAMARGRAVVAPSLPGIRSMTGDGRFAPLYPAGDVPRLAELLVEYLDPSRAAEEGVAARSFAESTFHPARVASATRDFYAACAADRVGTHQPRMASG